MAGRPDISSGNWSTKIAQFSVSVTTSIFFLFLDLLDAVLCVFYRFIDEFLEGNSSVCYCDAGRESSFANGVDDRESELSDTLFRRKNVFREMGFLRTAERKLEDSKKRGGGAAANRWSDCGCESCLSWMRSNNGGQNLHVVVKESSQAAKLESWSEGEARENVIFLHGFLSSSSFWTQTIFPNFSTSKYRLFAVDLLGFGNSPKPRNCFYTLKDHVEMIEKSTIFPYKLDSFHLVAHSMGCVIALALAAKYNDSVKSITLIAPPYFPASEHDSSLTVLKTLARKSLWPPILFGSSFMSWYEHLGRCICFLVCRNHRTWEWILKLITRKRELHYMIIDLTRHTHNSAWHTMHNVICGGAKLTDSYLEILGKSGVKIVIIQGDQDQVVPLECSKNIKKKISDADVRIIDGENHSTVIIGREDVFTKELQDIWASVS